MILAGDIGGTNTRLAFFELKGERLRLVVGKTFPSQKFESLETIVKMFVSEYRLSVEHACFGIAGPVTQGHGQLTNLAWVVKADQLAKTLGIRKVGLINDLEANAYGLAGLVEKDFFVLNQGASGATGNLAVIAAGTGLGEAGCYWDGKQQNPFSCEGGHTDFGPRNQLEMDLLNFLLPKFERVSYERILSGPGLFEIYKFLRDTGHGEEPPWLAEEIQQQDPSVAVSNAALENRSELCRQTLDLFISIYGAEAGNLALKIMARGGVYIGGGIAPKIIEKLKSPIFMEAFTAKGRMKPVLEAMPVRVILNDKTALLGAARYAISMQSMSTPSPMIFSDT